MMKVNNQEMHTHFKRFLQQYIKENMEELSVNREDQNNSFIFLEDRTLQLIITYMFMKLDSGLYRGDRNEKAESAKIDEIISELDVGLAESREGFEEVIRVLREGSS